LSYIVNSFGEHRLTTDTGKTSRAYAALYGNVARALRRWCSSEYDQRDADSLLRFAVVVARQRFSTPLRLTAVNLNLGKLEDAAILAVERLFERLGPDSEIAIALEGQLASDDACLVGHFAELCASRAYQALHSLRKEIDPDGARLDHNLKRAIRRHSQVELLRSGNRLWLSIESRSLIPWTLPPWCEEELARQLCANPAAMRTCTGLLDSLIQIIRTTPARPQIVEYKVLFAAVRVTTLLLSDDQTNHASEPSHEQRMAAEECLKGMERKIDHLLAAYLRSAKLTKTVAGGMRLAVLDLAQEWLHDGFGDDHYGFFDYLHPHLHELVREQFHGRLEDIFGRVQSEARNDLLDCLKRKPRNNVGK
jgi:hypothetical protein